MGRGHGGLGSHVIQNLISTAMLRTVFDSPGTAADSATSVDPNERHTRLPPQLDDREITMTTSPHLPPPTHRPLPRWALGAGAALLSVGVLAGCSGTSSSSGGSMPQSQASAADRQANSEALTGGGDASPAASPADGAGTAVTVVAPGTTTGTPRKVSRAEVAVTVDDLTKASATVRGLAAAHGGYVATESVALSETSAVDDGYYSSSSYSSTSSEMPPRYPDSGIRAQPGEARIVLRVAPDDTQAVMDAIAKVGDESSRWRTDSDVELQLVDLESRIATQTRAIEDLRVLMAKATSVSEILAVEQEISSRTADLESLKAQQSSLSDATAYSTVTAVLRTPERTEAAASEAGFLGGLKAGWEALTSSVRVILTAVGAILPFAVVALLIWYPARRWLRPRLAAWLGRRRAARASRTVEQQRAQTRQWQLAHAGTGPSTPGGQGAPGGPGGQGGPESAGRNPAGPGAPAS